MDTNSETLAFEEAVALQFDLLRGTHLILKECGADTEEDWHKSMESVLASCKQQLEDNELTKEQYQYIVDFWLDNFLSTTRPLLQ